MQTFKHKGHLIHFNSSTGRGSISYNLGRGFLSEDIKTISEGRQKIDYFVAKYQERIDKLKRPSA